MACKKKKSDLKCGMWHTECGMWNVECGMWNVECGMWNVECGTPIVIPRNLLLRDSRVLDHFIYKPRRSPDFKSMRS